MLIDTLLEDSRFDLNFMRVFDVMLMERKPKKIVKPHLFRAFLRKSLEQRKGLDQIVREILTADGVGEDARPAARFLLDRDAEPHEVTRAVGRLFLGTDMQCAQCHDHPSINDYVQADYYGVFAYLNRSFLFEDKQQGKVIAEKADGEASFVSVFQGGQPQKMMPHLPGGRTLDEPQLGEDEQYLVKPADDVRPVPAFSRRAVLAGELTSGRHPAFQRNLANRIWAHMMGRGLVHPLDFHHRDNPPSHPELLEALSDLLVDLKFDLGKFVREIARSKAYQFSSALPPGIDQFALTAEAARVGLLQQQEEISEAIKSAEPKDEDLQRQDNHGRRAIGRPCCAGGLCEGDSKSDGDPS